MDTWAGRGRAVSCRDWPLRQAADFLLVLVGWAAIVVSSAVLPVEELGLQPIALYLHLTFIPLGFGAVVMMNVYTILWRAGRHGQRAVLALTNVAHRLMAVGLAGLTATGIALDPDLTSPLMRIKLVLLLVLMLNAARVQQATRRTIGPVAVSQIAWWGTIGIGFLITTSR